MGHYRSQFVGPFVGNIVDSIILGKSANLAEIKYGRNTDIDTTTVPEDIWKTGGLYTGFPVGINETVTVLSSSASDTLAGVGAKTIRILGLDANGVLQQEDLNMAGIGGVISTKIYSRLFRAFILTAGTSKTNVGTITIRHTTTTANVFANISPGIGQTEVGCYTIPKGYTAYLTELTISLNDNTANRAVVAIWMRPSGGAERIQIPHVVATDAPLVLAHLVPASYPELTDIAIRCLSVLNNNADISVDFHLLLILND